MARKIIKLDKKIILGDTPSRKWIISPNDTTCWKYEMIREASLKKKSIELITDEFGFSREMFFYYKKKFLKSGIKGLMDEKTGPRKKTKRTAGLEKKIIEIRFKKPHLNMYDITDMLKKEGFDISPRTVSRTLTEHGLILKKTKGKFQVKDFLKKVKYLKKIIKRKNG